MGDYISREAAIRIASGYCHPANIAEELSKLPAADVRPVVRGKWYWDNNGMDWGIGAWLCSVCKAMSPMWWNCDKGSPMYKSGHNFCPNCGADMREES